MKYDGSGGVRASYSRTRLSYVRWTARILDGVRGREVDGRRLGDTRPVGEDDPVADAAAPALLAVDLDADASPVGLQMGSIFLDLPRRDDLDVELADRLGESLDLEPLHREEGARRARPELLGRARSSASSASSAAPRSAGSRRAGMRVVERGTRRRRPAREASSPRSIPSSPASRSAAMIRCGHADPSPVRISTRAREPRSLGTRQNAVRLSWPQFAWVGARLSGRIRL